MSLFQGHQPGRGPRAARSCAYGRAHDQIRVDGGIYRPGRGIRLRPRLFVAQTPGRKAVTEQAYDNAYFVEDVVRNVAARLGEHPHVVWFRVEVESFESIHCHNAFARIERSRARGLPGMNETETAFPRRAARSVKKQQISRRTISKSANSRAARLRLQGARTARRCCNVVRTEDDGPAALVRQEGLLASFYFL